MSGPPRELVVLMNPHGGGGRAARRLARAEPVLTAAGVRLDVHPTAHPGHARQLARELELRDGAAVCAVGGDGTIHEVVNGLLERDAGDRPALAVIPGGTGNSLMTDLRALDPTDAARRIVAGGRRPLDVARLDSPDGVLHAFNIIGWGLVASVGERAERMRWLGPRRYQLASVIEALVGRPRPARLELPDEVLEGDLRLVFAGNTQHTGAGMRMTPAARIDDGLLDVLVVRGGSRAALLKLLAGVPRGAHLGSPLVSVHRVDRFRLEAGDDRPLNIDGELVGRPPLDVAVLPGALDLLV